MYVHNVCLLFCLRIFRKGTVVNTSMLVFIAGSLMGFSRICGSPEMVIFGRFITGIHSGSHTSTHTSAWIPHWCATMLGYVQGRVYVIYICRLLAGIMWILGGPCSVPPVRSCSELWPSCLSWLEPKNLLLDTSCEGGHKAVEEEYFGLGWSRWILEQQTFIRSLKWLQPLRLQKQNLSYGFGEAKERDIWLASKKFWQFIRRLRRGRQGLHQVLFPGGKTASLDWEYL